MKGLDRELANSLASLARPSGNTIVPMTWKDVSAAQGSRSNPSSAYTETTQSPGSSEQQELFPNTTSLEELKRVFDDLFETARHSEAVLAAVSRYNQRARAFAEARDDLQGLLLQGLSQPTSIERTRK
jgi:hypothetical protein